MISPRMIGLQPGDQVELVDRLPVRPHLRIGTRGRVLKLVGFWGLAEVVFEAEPRPAMVKNTHLRRVDAPFRTGDRVELIGVPAGSSGRLRVGLVGEIVFAPTGADGDWPGILFANANRGRPLQIPPRHLRLLARAPAGTAPTTGDE